MQAIVAFIDRRRDLAAVKMASDDYAVIDLMGGIVSLGEILEGDFEKKGSQSLRMRSAPGHLRIRVEACHVTADAVREICRPSSGE